MYLHFDSFQRVLTSGPGLPRHAVKQSVRHDATGVVAAVEVGHVAPVVPPGRAEAPRTAAVLELSFYHVVVNVERRKPAAVMFEQRVARHSAAAQRLFAITGDVQPVAVNFVCDTEVIVVYFMCQVVPVCQANAQRVVVLVSEQVDYFVSKPVFTSNAFTTDRFIHQICLTLQSAVVVSDSYIKKCSMPSRSNVHFKFLRFGHCGAQG